MAMTREDAIKKAAMLLNHAAGAQRINSVHEAATAAAMAQALMDKWELTRDLVERPTTGATEIDEAIESFYDRPEGWLDSTPEKQPWRYQIAVALAGLNGCYIFTSKRNGRHQHSTLEIVGRPSGVETVRYMYEWITREVRALIDKDGRGMGLVWRREFAEGAASEIAHRLWSQRQQTINEVKAEHANNPHALVKIEQSLQRMRDTSAVEAFATERHQLRPGGHRRVQSHETARDLGRAAGRRVNLNPARGSVGPGARRQIGGGS